MDKREPGENARKKPIEHWRLAAVAMLLGFALIGALFGWFEVCSDSLNDEGDVVRLCRPPMATDFAVLVGMTILLALIWDQLSEMGIPGLFTLKRRLDQAEGMIHLNRAETERQGHRQEQLETQLALSVTRLEQSLATVTSASSHASIGDTYYVLSERGLSELAEKLPGKTSTARTGRTTTPLQEPVNTDPSRALLVSRLLAAWEELQGELEPPPVESDKPAMTVAEYNEASARNSRFRTLFREEINAVRAARNTVAHARPISDAALEEALGIATELLRILRSGNLG